MNDKSIRKIPDLIRELYGIVDQLQLLFPGRRFTPDGHLVGSIGEVLAVDAYGLELFPSSFERHDAKSKDGKLVQIKSTQVKSIGLSSKPDHLLVIQIQPDGSFLEIFNGPGEIAWSAAGKLQKNGQRPITTYRLRILMKDIEEGFRLPRLGG